MKLVLDNIGKSFDNNVVLKDVDITLEPDRIYGLLGRNGTGKTTIFNCLSEEIKKDNGSA